MVTHNEIFQRKTTIFNIAIKPAHLNMLFLALIKVFETYYTNQCQLIHSLLQKYILYPLLLIFACKSEAMLVQLLLYPDFKCLNNIRVDFGDNAHDCRLWVNDCYKVRQLHFLLNYDANVT